MNKTYLEKQQKIKEENLKYDFLPSMLEIIEKPENKVSNIIIWLVLALIVSAVVWAAFAKTDIAITAQGSIMPKGNLISVSSSYGGEIKEIAVEEGQNVKKGDLLFSLDTSAEEESKAFLEYELNLLYIQQETYSAIKTYRENQPVDKKEQKLESEKNGQTDEQGIAEEEESKQSKWDKYGVELTKYGNNISIAEAILTEEELYEVRLKEYRASLQTAQNKEVAQGQLEELIAERDLTILQNLNSLRVKIKETEKNIDDTERIIEQKSIKAQVGGIVTNLSVNTTGQLINAGTQVAYIIPENYENVFKAYVKSSDIEGLKQGDTVSVRIAALKDTPYDRIAGRIQRIGDAAVSVEGMGNAYRVDIGLSDIPEEYLKTGQEGICDILIGKRSVLNYFLEPFIMGMKESLHEK